MRRSPLLLCVCLLFFSDAFGAPRAFNPVPRAVMTPEATAEQRIIVKLRRSDAAAANPATDGTAALAQRTQLLLRYSRRIAGRLHVMRVVPATAGESVRTTLARLRADPAVEYAEADQRRYAHALADDPLFLGPPGQWYLKNAGATPSAVDTVTAWDTTKGSTGIVIADLDTGVRFDHPDLLRAGAGGRLLPGYDFISDLFTANDGDGRDADASDPGDWVSSSEARSGCPASDSSWHGTRVAGILGAITNNNTGVAGATWNSWLLPVRVLGKCGGYDSDIFEAMLWAAGMPVSGVPDNPYPAQIENLSFGSPDTCPAGYTDVIAQLKSKGVLVVVSAGNVGGPVDTPANCAGVAAVAGIRHIGTKVGYSSLGPEVALSAPAGNCVNIAPTQPCTYSIDTTVNNGTTVPGTNGYTDQFNFNVGTSFSAPIVAAIAGLMKAVNGNLNSTQMIARLQEGTTTFPISSDPSVPGCHVPTSSSDIQNLECTCTTQTCGAGMANARKAVAAALRPIAAVQVPVNVSPGLPVSLQGGGSAAACNHNITAYAWSTVSGSNPSGIANANTVTATVTAPSSGSYTVRLTVTDDASRQDTADVIVSSTSATTSAPANAGNQACLASIVVVSVAPVRATLLAGSGTQTFTAGVVDTTNTDVIWKVNNITGGNATVGTISTTGVYTAPATAPAPATVTVMAVSTADTTRTSSAQVTITSPATASSGGGGGGAMDIFTLLAAAFAARRRRQTRIG
ncbi:MAG: S8 family serine peptidase [Gammaproteobacteria bacterium]